MYADSQRAPNRSGLMDEFHLQAPPIPNLNLKAGESDRLIFLGLTTDTTCLIMVTS